MAAILLRHSPSNNLDAYKLAELKEIIFYILSNKKIKNKIPNN